MLCQFTVCPALLLPSDGACSSGNIDQGIAMTLEHIVTWHVSDMRRSLCRRSMCLVCL